jgi:glutathione S-transferase
MKLVVGDYNLSSWSLRPWLALTHAGLAFEVERIRLDRPETKAAILAASPSGKVPALRLDDGVVVGDSLAICEYAAEHHPASWPADRTARAVARSAACEMHSGFAALRREHPMNLLARTPKPPSDEVRHDVARITELWRALRSRWGAGGPFLFGDWSIADAMFTPVATRFRTYAIETDPVSEAYAAALLAHPAMVEWERRARIEVEGGS